uniref:Pancreatic progenitor cell differentiation and proliferation factor B-like n=1 Tax=Cyprinus carpio TaxID=7962 RepID=A0A8C2EDI2_CYPCA
MAAIPASGSLVATHDYYRSGIGSTSSSSSCGSSEYSGEVIPHHPGLPKQDSGHWWSSFFFGEQNQPGMGTLTEEAQQKSGVVSVTNGQVTGAPEAEHTHNSDITTRYLSTLFRSL